MSSFHPIAARLRSGWPRHVLEASLVPFRFNRQFAADESQALLVNGTPAPAMTVFDRARFERKRAAMTKAAQALRAAETEIRRPYALLPEIVRLIRAKAARGANLAGSIILFMVGLGVGVIGGFEASQPDPVLLRQAMRQAQHPATSVSASDARQGYLVVIGIGVAILIWAAVRIVQWLYSPGSIPTE